MSTLAAARADNFYYPPGWTPEQGSLNKYQGQHPLRERARKLDQGILVIRFEMPFHVWCGGCESMIAKGVRFNAEKKQIGNYHSTKIWSFKMKAACCQHQIEIHTDPKNCDYVVVSGAVKKVVEYDAEDAGTAALPTQEEREMLADPLCKVEHSGEDASRAKGMRSHLLRLKRAADAKHADTWRLNSTLRAQLRGQRRRVAAEEAHSRARGLAIRLLPASDADSAGAALAHFRPRFDDNAAARWASIKAASIFSSPSASASASAFAASASAPASASVPDSREASGHAAFVPSEPESRRGQRKGTRSSGVPKVVHEGQRGAPSPAPSLARRAELAAKRRRIDAVGALQLVSGKS